jgi:hypothetical protein
VRSLAPFLILLGGRESSRSAGFCAFVSAFLNLQEMHAKSDISLEAVA